MVLSLLQSTVWNDVSTVVRSDGRGYYAYLPALLIHTDPSFERVVETENAFGKGEQIYLYEDVNGNTYNKYFPGLAILQSPFFIVACGISWLSGTPVDGYNDIFMWMFLIGSISFLCIGILSFAQVFRLRFPNFKSAHVVLSLLVLGTPILYYGINSPSFTHVYSFGLFGLFALLVLKLKTNPRQLNWIYLGVVLGLIFLVRPTNILVVTAIPLLLKDFEGLKSFVESLFKRKGRSFISAFLFFLGTISLLFISWYWQTGSWVVWSYNGEGFDFMNPRFFTALFSYRIGLFLHTPMLLLVLISLFVMRKRSYELSMFLLYLIINTWVISSWWCWDYESVFGNRPFTEHMVLLFLPAVYFIDKYRKLGLSVMIVLAFFGVFRMYQTINGITPVARYTVTSYWSSLVSIGSSEEGRFNFTESCEPHGAVLKEEVVLERKFFEFEEGQEFALSKTVDLPKPRTNERYYYTINLKKIHQLERFEGVYLVIDATSNDSDERSYRSIELFNDRREGYDSWSTELKFQGIIHDNKQEFDQVKFYIWNSAGKVFSVKDLSYKLSLYKD